jgi:phosphate transport system substrate-binding protein
MSTNMKKGLAPLRLAGLLSIGVASLGAQAANAQTITGAGATFPYPIYSKWFSAYAQQKGVRINYQSVGSGAGIRQLKNRTVDFGATDAALSNSELRAMPGPVVHIPTVAGAVAVVYNVPGVGKGLRLDGATTADIFQGKIKSWDDARIRALNPGRSLPSRGITIAHRSDGSGTTNIFTSYLKAVSPSWSRGVGAGKTVNWPVGLGGKGNDGVAGIVKQTSGAIGYVELAYAEQNRLAYATLKNKSGRFVAPSVSSVTAAAVGGARALQRDVRSPIVNSSGATAYPISGFTYILLYRNHPRNAAMKQFLTWAIGPGQSYARPLLYAPLPRSIVALNRKTLATIR